MPLVVGIAGVAGAGKSTLAAHLCAALPRAVPVSLAAYFKVSETAFDGLPVAEVFGPAEKSDDTRRKLQEIGTEKGRDVFGPDIWLKHADADIYRLARYGTQYVVIDDVRFLNEAEWVRNRDGVVIRLVGRGGLNGPRALHPSEVEATAIAGDLTLDTNALPAPVAAMIAQGFVLGRTPTMYPTDPETTDA